MPNHVVLDEHYDWRGQWWQPERPDEIIAGTLAWDPKAGGLLELIGGFDTDEREQIAPGQFKIKPGPSEVPIIHGIVDGRPATLVDCLITGTRRRFMPMGGGLRQDLKPEVVLLGTHLTDTSAPAFRSARASIEGLTAWSGIDAFTITRSSSGANDLVVHHPADERADVHGDLYRLMSTTFGPDYRVGLASTDAHARHLVEIEVTAPHAVDLDYLRSRVWSVAELISLAQHRRTRLLSLRAALPSTTTSEPRATWGPWVEILYRQAGDSSKERVDPRDLAFWANEPSFDDLIRRWSGTRARLSSAISMLLASWAPGWYLEARVLTLITALESLEASLGTPRRLPDAEFRAVKEAAVAAVPAEQQPWLQAIIQNNISLQDRLRRLIDLLPDAVRTPLVPSPSAWARAATRARNELSHSGRTKLDHEGLFALGQLTSAVAYLLILNELGVPEERLKNLLTQDSVIAYTRRLAAEHFSD